MRMRMLALASTALITTLVLAGCGQNNDPGMSGMDHGSSSSSPSSSEASADFNAADEMFVTMMIPHHQQAIEMADLILGKDGIDERVVTLAQQIKDAQGPEIETMQGWLQEWGLPSPDPSAGGMEGMDHGDMDMGGMTVAGMMSAEDMATLANATGADFDTMWLQMMIAHHQGAIAMAEVALRDSRDPEIRRMAQAVIDIRTREIAEMKAWTPATQ